MLGRLLRLFGYRRRFFEPSGIAPQQEGSLFRRCATVWMESAKP